MELILILQIIPFICIVAKINCAQHGIKGYCNLVPTDLKKIQTILPMACNKENLISLLLKRQLYDKSAINMQQIRPALVNRALENLNLSSYYQNVTIDNDYENLTL